MKQHEREYFTSRIRSGIYKVQFANLDLVIKPLTIEEELEVQEAYTLAFLDAEDDGLVSHDEMLKNLEARGLWSKEDEEKEEALKKDIDSFKVELYQNRTNSKLLEKIRQYLAVAKMALIEVSNKRYQNYENTVEGYAIKHKNKEAVKKAARNKDGAPYIFSEEDPLEEVVAVYTGLVLSEKAIREIAKTEPWRSLWILSESKVFELFANKGKELTPDQRNLLIWSRMYDNIHESMDCPPDEVIEDDDMLDGWLLIQKKKREQEQVQNEVANKTSNSKISNSDEIFVMAGTQEDANKINSSNSFHNQQIKKQRMQIVQQQGEAKDLDFPDQQLKMRQKSNQMFKDKFRR